MSDPNVKFYEVVNKTIDNKTGKVSLFLVDTGFSTTNRYALIGPSSVIKSAVNQREFNLSSSFNSVFGDDEYLKWVRYDKPRIKVRAPDSSVVAQSGIKSISGNTITLDSDTGFPILPGYIMELSNYDGQTPQIKLLYGYMLDASAFADGKAQYKML